MLQSLWRPWSDVSWADRQERVIRYAGSPCLSEPEFHLVLSATFDPGLSVGCRPVSSLHFFHSTMSVISFFFLPNLENHEPVWRVQTFQGILAIGCKKKRWWYSVQNLTEQLRHKHAFLYKVMIFHIMLILIFAVWSTDVMKHAVQSVTGKQCSKYDRYYTRNDFYKKKRSKYNSSSICLVLQRRGRFSGSFVLIIEIRLRRVQSHSPLKTSSSHGEPCFPCALANCMDTPDSLDRWE